MKITRQQLKHVIKEEIHSFAPQDMYLRNDKYDKRIFERSYVTGVLGIRLPLNESYPYSSSIQRRIIQEQLLFEGFFSDILQKGKDTLMSAKEGIAKFGKEAWSILKGFYIAVKEGGADALASSIDKKSISKFFKPIYAALKWLSAKLPGWNMPTFASMVQKGLDLLDKMKDKLNSIEGWKKVAMFSGVAVGMQWLWNKIGDWVEDLKEKVGGSFEVATTTLSEDEDEDGVIKSWIKDTAKEAMSSLIGGDFMKKITDLAAAATVSAWWKAATTAGKGAKLVVDALGAATERFVSRFGTKLKLPEETQSEALVRRYIRATLLVEGSG